MSSELLAYPPRKAGAREPQPETARDTAQDRRQVRGKRGRPRTELRVTVIQEIMDRLSAGEPLRQILPDEGRPPHLPHRAVFARAVVANQPPTISDQYARARQAQAMNWAEELLELADAPVEDMVALGHARLRVDTRKWLLSKVLPKLFGDRLEVPVGTTAIPYPVIMMPPLDERQ